MADQLGVFVGITFALIMSMFIIDLSMDSISSEVGFGSGSRFMDYETSQMRQFDTTGNYTLTTDVTALLPNAQVNKNVQDDQGTIFSDVFGTMRSWLDLIPGFTFISGIVNTLPNFLKILLPGELSPIAFALGYAWFGMFVFAIIVWIKGGSA
jgi:hypothetical protein